MEFDSYGSQNVKQTEKNQLFKYFDNFFINVILQERGGGVYNIFSMEGEEKHFFKENIPYTIYNICFTATYFKVKNYCKFQNTYKSSLSLLIYNKSIFILIYENA